MKLIAVCRRKQKINSIVLIAGLKAGGIAAFGCGVLGFTGGTVLKRKEEMAEEAGESSNPAGEETELSTPIRRPADPNKED